MSVDPDDYLRTTEALAALNLSIFNTLAVLLVRLAKKGVLDKSDLDLIENEGSQPLHLERLADSEIAAVLIQQRDELFSGLRKLMGDR